MALLYARVHREAQAWENRDHISDPVVHDVRSVGFAGFVGHSSDPEADHHNDALMKFVDDYPEHQGNLGGKISHGTVDLGGPVYATQSHVSQSHLDKYHANPSAPTDRMDKYGPSESRYHGDHAPIFVYHQGRLHVTEGHHRVAAALQRGDSRIQGYHYNADHHGFPQHDEDDEDW